MAFIHGLAMVLVIFEGIIIQCKGTEPVDTNSLIRIRAHRQVLPNDLIEVIINKSDFEVAQNFVQLEIINATDPIIGRMLRDRIVMMTPDDFDGDTCEYYKYGELFLRFRNYGGLVSFFHQFGDQVKKIKINYARIRSRVQRAEINQNIFNRYAKNLEELRITCRDDKRVWEEISNGDNDFFFPEVKKFHYYGASTRNEFKLNSIFPRLESFLLVGSVADVNCLANITTLKELSLNTPSIKEHQLDHIYANNKNMTKILLMEPTRWETMHVIAKELTKLQTLELEYPTRNFLIRSNNRRICDLSSVIHLDITFYGMYDLSGDLSFDMPHLKKLSLKGKFIDDLIIKFINQFKELETVELLVRVSFNPVKCIEKLQHIKEFTVNSFENSELNSLRNYFEDFDEECKLQTLKLVDFDDDSYKKYQDTMKGINKRLVKYNKPTWTLSQVEQKGTDLKYLMFKRAL